MKNEKIHRLEKISTKEKIKLHCNNIWQAYMSNDKVHSHFLILTFKRQLLLTNKFPGLMSLCKIPAE